MFLLKEGESSERLMISVHMEKNRASHFNQNGPALEQTNKNDLFHHFGLHRC